MVCPMDNMEWELKVRNQAMKQGCASVQMDSLKKSLFMLRTIVDTIVQSLYIIMQIIVCLFRLALPLNGEVEMGQIMSELEFWFNELIIKIVESVKQLANLLFNMIFSTGPLGSVMKTILQWVCKILQTIIWIWNETGDPYVHHAMPLACMSSTCYALFETGDPYVHHAMPLACMSSTCYALFETGDPYVHHAIPLACMSSPRFFLSADHKCPVFNPFLCSLQVLAEAHCCAVPSVPGKHHCQDSVLLPVG
jgi:hypothetical protein